MTNSVNSFRHLDELFAKVFGEQNKYFTELGLDKRTNDEAYRQPVSTPNKPTRTQRMKTQINFNISKFTNHRYVGNGIKAVNKRKFNPEVN